MSDPVTRGYDRLAPWYQTLEWLRFGGGLQRARTALLPDLPRCQQALFIGDGDGRLLQAFVQQQPQCQVTSIDISSRMLSRQRQRLAACTASNGEWSPGTDARAGSASQVPAVRWVQADIRHCDISPRQYDLIVTAFHLDCFSADQIERLVTRLEAALRQPGYWYVVDFAIPHCGWRQGWAKFWTALMIAFFRWQTALSTSTLTDLPPLFLKRGWTVSARWSSRSGMLFSLLLRRPS